MSARIPEPEVSVSLGFFSCFFCAFATLDELFISTKGEGLLLKHVAPCF